MPRMPKSDCPDCHIPVSAEEDVKLKLLEKKIYENVQSSLKTINGKSLTITDSETGILINGIVSVSQDGNTVTITTDNNKTFEFTVKGEKGEKGDQGEKGEKGDKGDKGDPGVSEVTIINGGDASDWA